MYAQARWRKYWPVAVVALAILASILLGAYFDWPRAVEIPLLTVLVLVLAAVALWRFANREVDGSEWWQDDSASGWRGY